MTDMRIGVETDNRVPLLANPAQADFIQAYGKGGRRAMTLGQLKNLGGRAGLTEKRK